MGQKSYSKILLQLKNYNMRNYFLDHVWRLISLLRESLYWRRQIFKKISNLFLNGFSGIWAQIWRFNKAFFLLFKKVFKIFLKNNFFIRIVYFMLNLMGILKNLTFLNINAISRICNYDRQCIGWPKIPYFQYEIF